MQNVFDILQERNYIEQMTHPEQMKEMFSKESVPFYIGIDPTADSLHVGHFVSLMVASHMQKCGARRLVVYVHLNKVAHLEARVLFSALSVHLYAFEAYVFMQKRSGQHGGVFAHKAVEPLLGIVFSNCEFFHDNASFADKY